MRYKNKEEKFEILNIFKVVYAHGISLSNPLSNPAVLNIWGDIAPDILPLEDISQHLKTFWVVTAQGIWWGGAGGGFATDI